MAMKFLDIRDGGQLIFSHDDRRNVVFSDDQVIRHGVGAAAEYLYKKDKSLWKILKVGGWSPLSFLLGIILGLYGCLFIMYLSKPDEFMVLFGLAAK